jgi:membrane protease YdiL (CAAX protease family)
MTLLDHLFALVLLAGLPAWAVVKFGRLRARIESGDPDARASEYRKTIAMQWLVVAGLGTAWWAAGRRVDLLGFVMPGGLRLVLTVALSAGVVALFWRQHAAVLASADLRTQVRAQLDKQPAARLLIPRTDREAGIFTWLALTAGICEEILYRGFLWWYASTLVPVTWIAAVLVAIVFGAAHAYQGVGGIVRTGIAGAVALAAYLGTGSLIAPIVLHATLDVMNGRMARAALLDANADVEPANPEPPGSEPGTREPVESHLTTEQARRHADPDLRHPL